MFDLCAVIGFICTVGVIGVYIADSLGWWAREFELPAPAGSVPFDDYIPCAGRK